MPVGRKWAKPSAFDRAHRQAALKVRLPRQEAEEDRATEGEAQLEHRRRIFRLAI